MRYFDIASFDTYTWKINYRAWRKVSERAEGKRKQSRIHKRRVIVT
jgi:hypothetical protein